MDQISLVSTPLQRFGRFFRALYIFFVSFIQRTFFAKRKEHSNNDWPISASPTPVDGLVTLPSSPQQFEKSSEKKRESRHPQQSTYQPSASIS